MTLRASLQLHAFRTKLPRPQTVNTELTGSMISETRGVNGAQIRHSCAHTRCYLGTSHVVVSRPVRTPNVAAAAAAASEVDDLDVTPQVVPAAATGQQSDEQEQQHGGSSSNSRNQVRQRIKTKTAAWSKSKTAGGYVAVDAGIAANKAARLLVEDIDKPGPTRVVALSPADIPKAVRAIWCARGMLREQQQGSGQDKAASNEQGNVLQKQQQQDEQQQEWLWLVFQPVKIQGALVAPPELPEKAVALYTYKLAQSTILQEVLRRRAGIRAAARLDDSSSSTVRITGASQAYQAAAAVAGAVSEFGWADVVCFGSQGNVSTAIEAIARARGILHRKQAGQDIAVVCALFRAPNSSSGQQQQLQWQQQPGSVNELPADGQGAHRVTCRLLVIVCAKDNPTNLKQDVAAGSERSSSS